jgi:L-fuconolactonase
MAATRACAGIVGHADLGLGDAVAEVLDAHIAAGNGGRFRGIRHMMAHDDDPAVLGPLGHAAPNLCSDAQVRAALKHFAARNLSLDIWVVEPQLPELVGLARAFPDVPMVVDHVGTPFGLGAMPASSRNGLQAGRRPFVRWQICQTSI